MLFREWILSCMCVCADKMQVDFFFSAPHSIGVVYFSLIFLWYARRCNCHSVAHSSHFQHCTRSFWQNNNNKNEMQKKKKICIKPLELYRTVRPNCTVMMSFVCLETLVTFSCGECKTRFYHFRPGWMNERCDFCIWNRATRFISPFAHLLNFMMNSKWDHGFWHISHHIVPDFFFTPSNLLLLLSNSVTIRILFRYNCTSVWSFHIFIHKGQIRIRPEENMSRQTVHIALIHYIVSIRTFSLCRIHVTIYHIW